MPDAAQDRFCSEFSAENSASRPDNSLMVQPDLHFVWGQRALHRMKTLAGVADDGLVRISAIVDAHFSLIVDAVSA
jgi:hypothetical protein